MAVRWPLVVRRTHKWLALVVGVQVVLWSLTGLYMVTIHISIIHGDHLVRTPKSQPFAVSDLVQPAAIIDFSRDVEEIKLERSFDRPVWRVQTAQGARLFDARTGAPLPALTESQVREQARRIYAGDGAIVSTELLTVAPLEMQTRKPPYWRVEFEGWNRPTLYLSPTTGELISRRHELWRIFDIAWMLHIMDYDERSDVNNPLLRVATWTTFAMSVTGAWLLIWSFKRRKRKKA